MEKTLKKIAKEGKSKENVTYQRERLTENRACKKNGD